MKLTNFTDYSLRTLIYLAVYPDRLCTTKEIAAYFKISQNHMVKITHNLSKIGYINTQKGRSGGISLLQSSKEINIGEAIQKLELDFNIVECFNCKENTCKIATVCNLKNVLIRAHKAFMDELSCYTLEDLIKNKDELLALFTCNKATH